MLARAFDLTNAGLGRVAMEMKSRMSNDGHDVITMSVGKTDNLSYLLFSLLDCHWELPEADVYHALTPVEGVYLPKDRSVVTFHDLFILTDLDRIGAGVGYNPLLRRLASIYYRWCCWMSQRARVIVCVSQHTKAEAMRLLKAPEGKIRVIRSGIRPELNHRPWGHDGLIIGYLGQLDRRKRVNLLIEAFRRANRNDAELWIGGIGRDEAMLKAIADGDNRIKFLGLVPDDRLIHFYNSLDWFAFPTAIEGYGLPLVEAMACKVPCVVLEDAIIPDEIKSRCFVTDDLAAFIRELPNAKVDGLEGNYRFAKSHDWDKTVEEYLEIYNEVVNG